MHIPVLLNETLYYLNPKPGDNFIDCTGGLGGHSLAILRNIYPKGKLLIIDLDRESIDIASKRIKKQEPNLYKNIIWANENFSDIEKIAQRNNLSKVNGILFDLGLSSWQIEESKRGFTFRKNEPLDMRFDNKSQGLTAKEIINQYSENELIKIFEELGEEKYGKRIAKAIIRQRKLNPISTSIQLLGLIKKNIPYSQARRGKLNRVAARIFQGLRIATNNELENIKNGLNKSVKILAPSGRIVIISFHSLEDRIVKRFLKEQECKGVLEILTKKVIKPSKEEIQKNIRSRSAKLRAAVKI